MCWAVAGGKLAEIYLNSTFAFSIRAAADTGHPPLKRGGCLSGVLSCPCGQSVRFYKAFVCSGLTALAALSRTRADKLSADNFFVIVRD